MEDVMKEAAAEAMKDSAEEQEIFESSEPSALDAPDDFEVPSYFDGDALPQAEESDASEPEPAPSESQDLEFEYTVGGQTYKATKAQALKALELQRGARQAFSERAKLKRELKKIQQQAEENAEFRERWKEVLADPSYKAVFEKLTGQSFDTVLNQEIERRNLLQRATPEERKILEYDQQMQSMKSQLDQFRSQAEQREKELAEKSFKAEVNLFQSEMSPIMEKAFESLAHSNPEIENTRWEMLWGKTIRDLKYYANEGYDVNKTLINQVAKRNAKAMSADIATKVDQGVEQIMEQKRSDAQNRAHKASTQNYTAPSLSAQEAVALNPLDLFKRMTGRT